MLWSSSISRTDRFERRIWQEYVPYNGGPTEEDDDGDDE